MEILLKNIENEFNCKAKIIHTDECDNSYKEIKTKLFFVVIKDMDEDLRITFLNVWDEYQGKGIGKSAFHLIEEYAKRKQYKTLSLVSADTTIEFWRKCGFHMVDSKRLMKKPIEYK